MFILIFGLIILGLICYGCCVNASELSRLEESYIYEEWKRRNRTND